jgi:NAD+ kinase
MIKKIGILARPCTEGIEPIMKDVIEWARRNGIELFFDLEAAKNLGAEGLRREILPEKSDLIIAFGGDGTILSIAPECAIAKKPIMGVNLGTLGFLAEFGKDETIESLEKIIRGEALISKRTMLEINYKDQSFLSLNEVTVSKAFSTRLIELTVYIDETLLASIRGDGLIFSTATGSTAYSLSAGGPILEPSLECIVMTPICPHTLSVRPIVLPPTAQIKLECNEAEDEIYITIDGKFRANFSKDTSLYIKKSNHYLLLVRSFKKGFYELLRDKLRWSGKLIG